MNLHPHPLYRTRYKYIVILKKKKKITSLASLCPIDFIPKMEQEKRKKKEMHLYKARDTVT